MQQLSNLTKSCLSLLLDQHFTGLTSIFWRVLFSVPITTLMKSGPETVAGAPGIWPTRASRICSFILREEIGSKTSGRMRMALTLLPVKQRVYFFDTSAFSATTTAVMIAPTTEPNAAEANVSTTHDAAPTDAACVACSNHSTT